ncbi:mitoferrin-2 isoform X2 [Sceloporus undulatus]|uniref:mitoferrin-2 isoform X2 n=1 Tax=Sceloporus undulatus TaxID=8520 RepID=UPI001C4C7268|nr:mitoferrin-2 isoform X2 [Sceloporus undulatus]
MRRRKENVRRPMAAPGGGAEGAGAAGRRGPPLTDSWAAEAAGWSWGRAALRRRRGPVSGAGRMLAGSSSCWWAAEGIRAGRGPRGGGSGGGGEGGSGVETEPEYEALPRGSAASTHMLAGAVAGVLEHSLMYPVDCVKTRMQSLQPEPAARYRNVLEALWRIVRTEGIWRPMRGLNVTATGAGPAHALYFACYEKLKKTLTDLIHAGGNSHVANVVKQRMQMYNSPYQRVTDCVRAVWCNEGAGAFYRSYTTQLTMNIPFQAIHFMAYESLQEHLNPHRQYNPSSHMVAGACAGAIAAAATTPLDVCKTLLNTQEALALNTNISGHITGMAHAFRTVYRVGGLTAYFRGVQARVIYQMPSTAIAWSVYEFFKYFLTKRKEERLAGK